jgi:hypothetical protein
MIIYNYLQLKLFIIQIVIGNYYRREVRNVIVKVISISLIHLTN